MVGKMLKRTVLGLFVVTLACGALLAQSGPAKAHTTRHGTITPAQAPVAGMTTIFSNLFPVTGSTYNTSGYLVSGSDTVYSEQWVSLPFTPAANAHVEELQLAVGIVSGTNLLDVTLASDNGGVVGTALASKTSNNVPEAGTCCALVTVRFKAPGIAVTAGTQYWIVATTNDTFGPTFAGLWLFSNLNWYGYNLGQAGWVSASDHDWPAAAVFGTIP